MQPELVTKLRSQRELPGTDFFMQHHEIVNIPGACAIWVGKMVPLDPAAPESEPKYETVEQAYIYCGQEFYSVEELHAAVDAEKVRQALRDRLGESIRRLVHGLIRPLWQDCTEDHKEHWRLKADQLMRLFASFDLSVVFARGDSDGR